jgi:SAM-dependent methyltransferase
MGIDATSLESILCSLKYVKPGGHALTLARQGIHLDKQKVDYYIQKYSKSVSANVVTPFCETLFADLGFSSTASIDCSSYESATILHDLNQPIPPELKQKYDYIYDGGTIEHIFNIAQVVDNISDMLKVGGIFCSVTVNNNLSGHGIYQFSPEFFLSAFSERYGMKVHELYLAEVNSEKARWIDVNSYHENNGGRNMAKFNSTNQVYIITIAEKISEDRLSVVTSAPQQYMYEQIDWKR